VRRLLAAVLLVLAASPLTAPFSVNDPIELFGGVGAHAHAKKLVDDPLASLCSGPAAPGPVPTEQSAEGHQRPLVPVMRYAMTLPLRL